MSDRVPANDWTDEEWLRVIKEYPPATDVRITEAAVAKWREEEAGE